MSFTQRKLNRLKKWDAYSAILKKYSRQPVIKNVDVEELKKQFAANAEAAPKAATKKKAAVEAEEIVAETPVSE